MRISSAQSFQSFILFGFSFGQEMSFRSFFVTELQFIHSLIDFNHLSNLNFVHGIKIKYLSKVNQTNQKTDQVLNIYKKKHSIIYKKVLEYLSSRNFLVCWNINIRLNKYNFINKNQLNWKI